MPGSAHARGPPWLPASSCAHLCPWKWEPRASPPRWLGAAYTPSPVGFPGEPLVSAVAPQSTEKIQGQVPNLHKPLLRPVGHG